ncbi:type 2 lanthipeptide synthetase LanM [Actinoplanes sp. M2I2]|uniref:type 2 lanthipeptide synthetase LanM n=1 Tax=Actinoplanes sp. M2I2 TaxID=1734444 RepID=UPI0020202E1E|nr:type 2 lanthipeptide synthetase LanM [Actinoplanes sp. M2I2]
MHLDDVRPLFPEIAEPADLRDFLTHISGPLVERAEPPADRTADLLALGALPGPADPGEPARFDEFARAFSRTYRAAAEEVFAGSPVTARRAGSLADDLVAWLTERAQDASLRTLVVVFDLLSRAETTREDARPDDRLRRFCAISGHPEFRATVFAVFPELRRRLTVLGANTVEHARRMVAATTQAVAEGRLPASATGSERPEITGIGYGLGDTHAGGRAVCTLTFDSGRTVVHKPRPMAAERAYGELVARIAAATGFELPALAVWVGDGCGWQEYADQEPGRPGPAYFRAAGRLLGVLHLLRAGDMHYENVLNHRGLPVVVDAESLFSVNHRAGNGPRSAEIEALADTVYSTGFLPTRITDPATPSVSLDIGFLGYQPGQPAVTAVPTLAGLDTGAPRIAMATGPVQAAAVRPSVVPRGVELRELSRGFAELYDWVVAHRDRVRGWLLELFDDLPTRAVLEATSQYYKLLRTSAHPTFQQSTEVRRILLHRVGLGRLRHFTAPVLRAEVDDLLQGDIPLFTLRTGSTWVHHRGRPIADVLRRTPLEQTVAGLDAMSPEGRERNLRVIRAAYVDLTGPECDAPAYVWRSRTAPPGNGTDRTREVVAAIAGELSASVVPGTRGDRPAWIGATIRDTTLEHPWRVDGLGDDLYAGAGGLALFLAAAGVLLDEAGHRDLARDALLPRVRDLLDDPARRRSRAGGGMAGGYAGLAFTALEVGRLTGSAELAELGGALWDRLPEDLDLITDGDFLLGSAGLLAAALTAGRPAVTDAVARHALAAVHPPAGKPVYTGFAHGTSGRIAALSRWSAATGRTPAGLTDLLRAHDALHDRALGHWPVSDRTPERAARGWCHGSPGVLLGLTERLAAGLPGDGLVELTETVRVDGFGLNPSLCHGDVGNLLILGQAARWDPSGRTAGRVADRRAQLAGQILPRMLRARAGKTVLNDALYVGLAGVGLGLVLSAGEVDVASPLTFRREGR